MNTRFLVVLSLIIAVFAVWFYRNQGNIEAPLRFTESNIEYQANDILAVQTDASGYAEYSLTADELTHFSKENVDQLKVLTVNWRPSFEQNVIIDADEAEIYHDDAKIFMKNNVILASKKDSITSEDNVDSITHKSSNDSSQAKKQEASVEATNPEIAPMRLMSSELIGDMNKKTLYSNKPIKVIQTKNEFEAASFEADLQSGVYEFNNVAVTFMPPKRTDSPLF